MTNQIHPSAIVSPHAKLGEGNTVGPYVVIEDNAELGNNNRIGAHSVIKNGSRIGNGNSIHEHVVFGGNPQDLGFKDAETFVQLGDNNVLREFVTINRATTKETSWTRIGNNNYFMAGTHAGHDCQLGNHIVLAPDAALGGHVHVGDRAFISGGVKIHQFSKVGSYAMIGGNSKITQDCLPYMITDGVPGRVRGLNSVGLKRAGFSVQEMRELKRAYRILFGSHRDLDVILDELEQMQSAHAKHLAEFIRGSKRNFHRAD
ncbi:MAG: acyl-ACP--UDP-N-acetylglucosamine O-acyltransferase [Gammaproteobacteria bacterium]|nr:acyl-ACP--UDP-N-acetylglucosamine O-acyltransferase [Gammaproteobacteria bacterium]